MRQQTTPYILMVRPAHFGFNQETAVNNAFQHQNGNLDHEAIHKMALKEFSGLVEKLREAGVQVFVVKDSARPPKPDAVFPNNWVTFHQEGFVITYPMFAPSRRRERRRTVIDAILKEGFIAEGRVNFEYNEKLDRYLEGTGSVIFDHANRLAYACLSPRTDEGLLCEICDHLDYTPVVFHATDGEGRNIYHTNVMMAMGETFVVICIDAVQNAADRQRLTRHFMQTGKTVVTITHDQVNAFAGNMLQVRNLSGDSILVMSERAFRSLMPDQIAVLAQQTRLLYSPLDTIEHYGGGSARCMMAEVFLPKKVSVPA